MAASSATFAYGYNGANQRISQAASDNSYWSYPAATPATVGYTANSLDQYSAVDSVSPTYDGNGNLTYDGVFTYGYDAESRLISASGAGNTASYAYDPQGRRKAKTVNGDDDDSGARPAEPRAARLQRVEWGDPGLVCVRPGPQ